MGKIRVLIIDDSALIRRILSDALAKDDGIEVIGTASDPYIARDKINELKPDVLTLDVEMPRMHGLAFLKILMEQRPMPVVMVSSLTAQGADVTLEALALGAVDFLEKPTLDVMRSMDGRLSELVAKIKAAARSRPRARKAPGAAPATPRAVVAGVSLKSEGTLLAIGASTGGTEAVRTLLSALPLGCPGVVVVQHMPPVFTAAFARRCNDTCGIEVLEGQHGSVITPGRAYIAPGGRHMRVVRSGARLQIAIDDGERINLHRPSVDALFDSVAELVGARAVGAILTGMGDDGARGLLNMRRAGAHTIAQDRATCVVFGMPREAIEIGAAEEVLPLEEIASSALVHLERASR